MQALEKFRYCTKERWVIAVVKKWQVFLWTYRDDLQVEKTFERFISISSIDLHFLLWASPVFPCQDCLAVLVEVEFGNNDLRRVDSNLDGLTRGLVPGDLVDVDHIFLTVNGQYFSLTTLEGSPDDNDFVIFSDGDRSDVVLSPQFLGQTRRHDDPSLVGRGLKMGLPGLAAGARDIFAELGHVVVGRRLLG